MGESMTDFLTEVFEAPKDESPVVAPIEAVEKEVSEPVIEQLSAPVVETPAEPEKQPAMVPIAALLDERDKRKAAEARIPLETQPAPKVPDPYDDPEGYHNFTQTEINRVAVATRFETSSLIATQAHGEAVVNAAATWAEEKAKADPSFATMYMREAHPIEWIVQQHKRDGLYSQIPQDITSLDELIDREIAKRGLTAPMTPQGVQPALKSAAPPQSIASDVSLNVAPVIDPLADFNAIFSRR
jgi:hypothetical protein